MNCKQHRSIHNGWKSLKLEPDYVFNDSNRGFHKDDVPVNSVLATSAHIVETGLKIYSQFSEKDGLAPDTANALYFVFCHLMRTL